MIVCLYNPKSRKRIRQIEIAAKILRGHRSGSVPVGICTALGTPEERTVLTTLDRFLEEEINMKSIVIIGSERTETLGPYMVTLRGYSL
jgi:precorrin-3B methylase